jgi:succinoglycan biosynthesis transport protein ExoP
MSINQILAILRARWVVALVVLVTVLVLTGIFDLVAPRKYTASASIMVDVKSPDPVTGMVLPAMMTPSYMAMLVSERVALRVVRSLRLNENEQMKLQWRAASKGLGDFDTWVAETIGKTLEVKPSRESNIITISYTGADPAFAAALCNAYVDSYINTSADLRTDPAKQSNTLFEDVNNQLRARLEKAQERVSAFQREHGLVVTDERLDIEMSRMAELSTMYTQLQAMAIDSKSRKAQISNRPDQSSEVLGNTLIASLKGDLSRLESKLEEDQAKYGDKHPTIVELSANIAALRHRITNEIGRVASSAGSNNAVNEQRLVEVKQSLEEQRAKVLRMKGLRDEASVMIRDVDNIQRAYDVVQARATQSRMESQASQTNLSVIKGASVPSDISSPKVIMHMLMAIFIGTLLALVSAIVAELLDRRMRTVDDVMSDMRLPLVGVMLRSADAKSSLLGKRMQPWMMHQYSPQAIAHSSSTF